jgi:hypothetical protein
MANTAPTPTASLGGILFPLDPESVGWRAINKTKSTNTVGGKVVQVYGTSISEVVIRGSFGTGGFDSAQNFYNQVASWVDQQVGNLTKQPGTGQGIFNGAPLHFLFPYRNWDMMVYILRFFAPGPGTDGSMTVNPNIVNYQWGLTLYIASINGNNGGTGNNGALVTETDASLISYVNESAQYFGWVAECCQRCRDSWSISFNRSGRRWERNVMDRALWGSNIRPSLPEPPSLPILVDLGGTGFCFTAGGIAHMVNDVDLEEYATPNYSPHGTPPISGNK